MTRDDLVRLGALALAALMALRPSSLGDVQVMVPLDPSRPTDNRKRGFLLYRFHPISSLGYGATFSPRLLLTLLLFPLWLLLLNAVVPERRDLASFIFESRFWLGYLALIAGGMANFWLIPFILVPLIAWPLCDHYHWPLDVVGPLAFAVVLPGRLVGGMISWNVATLRHELRLELKRRTTRAGEPIGSFSRAKKRFQYWVLWATPFMVLYEVVRFLAPRFDLTEAADDLRPYDPKRYALLLVALALGYNVLLNVLPLFREMLERASVGAAAGFELLLKSKEAAAREGKAADDTLNDMVKDHLTPDGKWRHYGGGQRFSIYIVVLVFCANGLAQSVEKLTDAGLSPADPRLARSINALGWFMLVVNGWFLFVHVKGRIEVLAGRQRIAERTLETMWRCVRDPTLAVIFRRERGAEVADEATFEPAATARAAAAGSSKGH